MKLNIGSYLEKLNRRKNGKGTKCIWILSYLYLTVPCMIFIIGWLGLRYSIPMTILIIFCMYKIFQDLPETWVPEWNQDNIVKAIVILFIIGVWVYFSGVGKYVFQNEDHGVRNVLFNILVENEWPVINYDILPKNEGAGATALIYYIGFWLPAAIVGKAFGLEAGYAFQAFWAILGIVLFYYFICSRMKKICIWPLIVFVFFSGWDIVGQYLIGTNLFTMENDLHLEWWISSYQYSSITTQLFWVFNQAVPAWLCTIMLYLQKNNRSAIFILACCMIQGTFPFVGLFALTCFWIFTRVEWIENKESSRIKNYIRSIMKGTCTIQNIVGGGIIGLVSFGYLIGNKSGGVIMKAVEEKPYLANSLFKLIVFVILEVGIYFIILYKYNKKNMLYYVSLAALCVIPLVRVGSSADFCMRVSIPFLIILYIYVIDALQKSWTKKDKILWMALFGTLLIGSVTPVHEFTRTVKNTVASLNEGRAPEILNEDEEEMKTKILNGENFSGVIDENRFYKYFVK